jgi:hypothetical protein
MAQKVAFLTCLRDLLAQLVAHEVTGQTPPRPVMRRAQDTIHRINRRERRREERRGGGGLIAVKCLLWVLLANLSVCFSLPDCLLCVAKSLTDCFG